MLLMKSHESPIINRSNSTFTAYTLVTSTNEIVRFSHLSLSQDSTCFLYVIFANCFRLPVLSI